MEEVIASKYTNAIIKLCDERSLRELLDIFTQAAGAFDIEDFRDIIRSPHITKVQKKELLSAICRNDERVDRFLDVLLDHNRVELIPFIANILARHIRKLENNHKALLYAPKNLSTDTISNIAQSLSNRLGVQLHIEQSSTKIDGIRLIIEDLGVEISFLKTKFFTDLKHHILKSL